MTPREEAMSIHSSFYYKLPNNGSKDDGINSCQSRFDEATICSLVMINRIKLLNKYITDEKLKNEFDEYWDKVKIEIDNNTMYQDWVKSIDGFISRQHDLDPEFGQIIRDNFNDLI